MRAGAQSLSVLPPAGPRGGTGARPARGGGSSARPRPPSVRTHSRRPRGWARPRGRDPGTWRTRSPTCPPTPPPPATAARAAPSPGTQVPRPPPARWPRGCATPRAGPRLRDGPEPRSRSGAAIEGGRPRAVPADRAVFPRLFPRLRKAGARAEPARRPRRRGVPECSQLTRRARHPEVPPEAPAASATGRRGRRRGLGPARPGSEGLAASAGGAPKGRQIPPERLATGQRFWQQGGSSQEGGGKEGGGGRRKERGREERRPPPARINHPADQMSPLCTREGDVPAHKGAAAPPLGRAPRSAARASRPLSLGTLPSPCSFLRGLRLRLGRVKSGWHSVSTASEGTPERRAGVTGE